MLVHEQARAVHRSRAVELPELAKRRRLSAGMVLHRLRVRANRAAVGVENAHRVGDDVKDRLELRDATGQTLSQLLALRDVAAGKENSAAAGVVGERRERRLDQPAPATMLKGYSGAGDDHRAP